MGEFRMPSLGADMEAGTLIEWLKAPGDDVARGDVIAVVETQKGAIEIEVFEDGRLEELLLAPGATVPVGTPMALINGVGPEEAAAEAAPAPPAPPKAQPQPPSQPTGKQRVSPAARRMAAERGFDLAKVEGSGPGGAVISSDIAAAARPPRRGLDMAEMRKAIAAAMARSKREIPHYYLGHTVDLTAARTWLDETNGARAPSERLLMGALLLKAAARAVADRPGFNGHYIEGAFQPSRAVHAGVAVAIRGGGLISPAIRDVDGLELDELMARMRDLVARARSGELRSSELADATVTVSSLGDRGVERLYGIIYPPQVALIGFGTPQRRPLVVDEQVVPRDTVAVTLAADHRVSDGHAGALLLSDMDRLLQEPEAL